MKIKKEHFDTLREIVNTADKTFPSIRESFEKGGISAKRFRWDLLYAGKASIWVCDNLYSYLNDDHIDTALKKITGTR